MDFKKGTLIELKNGYFYKVEDVIDEKGKVFLRCSDLLGNIEYFSESKVERVMKFNEKIEKDVCRIVFLDKDDEVIGMREITPFENGFGKEDFVHFIKRNMRNCLNSLESTNQSQNIEKIKVYRAYEIFEEIEIKE